MEWIIVLYNYQPGGGSKYLKNFSGIILCDGYQCYNKVEDITLVCCLAHCHKKFLEAIPANRLKNLKLLDINSKKTIHEPEIFELQDNEKKIPAKIGLAHCNKLFIIERQLKDLPPDKRMIKR